jgi:hypothetical protein
MFADRRYGNLGLLVLPTALISIGAGILFFFRTVYATSQDIVRAYEQYDASGSLFSNYSFDVFFVNTSAMWFIIMFSILLILLIISLGSRIGTGSHRLPKATPLFVFFYCFLAPLWLSAAVARAVFKTGVRWK